MTQAWQLLHASIQLLSASINRVLGRRYLIILEGQILDRQGDCHQAVQQRANHNDGNCNYSMIMILTLLGFNMKGKDLLRSAAIIAVE